ncbi:DNA polymerase III subunit gamma/tau [Burkholderia pseudomallei]|uniref:DNA polymerase III subunit gamma/tau n=1 Tax=Burkholderia pseudomallei TaxID=28450 RepID=UPI0004F7B087|nr:DNA polymerase III subunit gamma/tau [Burkholderia pseudomallei]AIP01052.1 putative dNA polymerase III, gamma and tau subunit [Burkholderia pseudomallei]KGX16914.1 putative dNA polymerase III, gamma and tau subunit [Burkholderia pseudomallei]KGX24593.1 putative dNA polymerase III, gamma and tau subunit [Burkholderia pseudomallei]UZU18495.1 DNA polymerase III subunit gamma/tau [Burkholderia pseudomallei]UZU19519.1 DNA polymerase III subunit gamma/tau [Burkholderia pseudomallei]
MQVSLRKMHIAPCRVSSDSMHIDCIIEDGVAEAVAKRFPAAAAEVALERVTRVTMRLRGVTAVGRSLRGAMIGAGAWRYRPLPPPVACTAEASGPRARRS